MRQELNAGPGGGRGAAAGAEAPQMVVASVPSGHVYIRHLTPEATTGSVRRLPDPDPDEPTRSAQQRWWPPVMLDPHWAENADFDIFHLQFGFDAATPEDLRRLVEVLRRRGKPLVQTVHDLRNPHHLERAEHDAQLDVLVPAATELITLTEGAAAEIRRRWGRTATVLPHPHVVDLDTMARIQARRAQEGPAGFRVGVHVKSLRASMDPAAVLPVLVETVAELPGAVLQVNGHCDVLAPDGARREPGLAAWLEDQAAAGRLELRVHDFLPDVELWDYLASLEVSVLPYRFGTHSGWLEACRDLGTAVVAPTCGYLHEQGPVFTYTHTEQGLDEISLRRAILAAYAGPRPPAVSVAARRRQRAEVAGAHETIYRRAMARMSAVAAADEPGARS